MYASGSVLSEIEVRLVLMHIVLNACKFVFSSSPLCLARTSPLGLGEHGHLAAADHLALDDGQHLGHVHHFRDDERIEVVRRRSAVLDFERAREEGRIHRAVRAIFAVAAADANANGRHLLLPSSPRDGSARMTVNERRKDTAICHSHAVAVVHRTRGNVRGHGTARLLRRHGANTQTEPIRRSASETPALRVEESVVIAARKEQKTQRTYICTETSRVSIAICNRGLTDCLLCARYMPWSRRWVCVGGWQLLLLLLLPWGNGSDDERTLESTADS